MSNYRILQDIDIEKLERAVSDHIDQGWKLGQFKVVPYRSDPDFHSNTGSVIYEYTYVQTVYKGEE